MSSTVEAVKTIKKSTDKVIIDVLILCIVSVPILVIELSVEPFRRGFFCDDESIAYPYKESTITTVVLISVCFGLPFVVFIFSELYIYKLRLRDRDLEWHSKYTYTLCGKNIHPYFVSIYKHLGLFLFGAAVTQAITDIMKVTLGRLRPHFLDVCKPNWSEFNCTMSSELSLMRYVEDYKCTGDESLIREARLSHPSGHASFSAYCLIYLLFYLQHRMTFRSSKLLKHLLQTVLLFMALFTSLSRINDYKHHWSDVLGGAVLGTSVSLLVVFFISDYFKQPSLRQIAKQLDMSLYGHVTRHADSHIQGLPLDSARHRILDNNSNPPGYGT